MKQKFVLLDIDNTLFNTISYKENFFKTLNEYLLEEGVEKVEALCDDVYKVLRTEKGLFAPEEFVDALVLQAHMDQSHKDKILAIIYGADAMEGNLYDDVYPALEELQKYATLGIFSQGSEKLQKMKVSPIMHFFHGEHIHVVLDKEKTIGDVFKKYTNEHIFLIDDALPVLHLLKKDFPNVTTIWMKRGRYALKQEPIIGFTPEKTILQLGEAIEIIKEA